MFILIVNNVCFEKNVSKHAKSSNSLKGKLPKYNIFTLYVILICQKEKKKNLPVLIGPILDDRLKEKSGNPERVPSVSTFVCVCMCVCLYAAYRAHRLT